MPLAGYLWQSQLLWCSSDMYARLYGLLLPYCRPEAFGQHPNAEISYLIEDSKAVLDGLLGLAPSTASGAGSGQAGGKRKEDLVAAIANDLLDEVSTRLTTTLLLYPGSVLTAVSLRLAVTTVVHLLLSFLAA